VRAHLGTRLTLVLLIAIPVFLFEFVESGRPQLGESTRAGHRSRRTSSP